MADAVVHELLSLAVSNVVPDAPPVDGYALLGGGICKRTFRVAAGERQYVVRLPQDSAGDVLDPTTECHVMQRVASAGLAPSVFGADAATGAIVMEYRQRARAWTADMACKKESIARAAVLLRSLHGLSIEVRVFAPQRYARAYVDAGEGATTFDDTDRRLARELLDLAGEYEQRYPPSVLCHNDLVAANILDEADHLKLVDFEYAVLGASVLDLGSLAAMNDFDSRQRRALLDAYYAYESIPFTEAEFARVVRMLRLIAYFWALASRRMTTDPGKYSDFAVRSDLESK